MVSPGLRAARGEGRRVPGVDVQADLAFFRTQDRAPELLVSRIDRHFVVGQVGRFEAVLPAEVLEPWEVASVLRGDRGVASPDVIAFRVDRDEKCRALHPQSFRASARTEMSCSARSCR